MHFKVMSTWGFGDYIREEAEADFIRLSNQVQHTYGDNTPVKIKGNAQGHTQNSFTSLDANNKPIIGGHNQQVLQLRNQSVDQAKVFQKKQNQQNSALTSTMNQLIPLLQQQLLQGGKNPIPQGQNVRQQISYSQQQQQNEMLIRQPQIIGLTQSSGQQFYIVPPSHLQGTSNNQPSQRNNSQRPSASTTAGSVVNGLAIQGQNPSNQQRQQSLKGLLGLDAGGKPTSNVDNGFMLRGLSINKNGQQQQPQQAQFQFYRTPYQKQ